MGQAATTASGNGEQFVTVSRQPHSPSLARRLSHSRVCIRWAASSINHSHSYPGYDLLYDPSWVAERDVLVIGSGM